MTRADALRALIASVEAGEGIRFSHRLAADLLSPDYAKAWDGSSLEAVVRLETGLRERGWAFDCFGPDEDNPFWQARHTLQTGPREDAHGCGPTEARARLLAVLKALLHEEDHP